MVINRNYSLLSADEVRSATREAGYADWMTEALVKVVEYNEERQHGNRDEFIRLLTINDRAPDWTTITRVFLGRYEAPEKFITERILPALKVIEVNRTGYVHTAVADKICELLDMWSNMTTMAEIVGPAGRSKTFSAYDWHLANPFAIFVDCPTVGGAGAFLREIARQAGLGTSGTLDTLSERIESKLDKRNILLVDEVVRILPASANPHSAGAKSLNFLQRLHDRRGVSVVFIATDILDRTFDDHRLEKYLAQLNRRIKYRYQVPEVTKAEVATIVRAFVDAPSVDLLKFAWDISTTPMGIGPLFAYLENAKLLADARGEKLGVDHLREATTYSRMPGIAKR